MAGRAAIVLLVVLVVLSVCGPAQGAFNDLAIAAKAGTLGIGGDLTTNLLPQVNLRAGVQWFGLDFDAEFGDIDYDVDIELLNPLVLIDWYPFDGSFRVSAGALFSDHDMELRATSRASITIGDESYEAAELGTLKGEVGFNSVAPYVGIGWGNALGRTKRWGLAVDLGVAFIGSPDVDLSATGPIASNPDFMANLAEEEREINDDLEDFKFYPVLCMSLFYRF
jgi:hypothetical protein